ncbi:Der GTPase-activating protein YihI [Pseudoalteromonas holothuriae]|uniref:Der GTPase-activating protein YihI n=1 Tax=Pseudoalteromonas holothuriae TaxID=2963714 RepID=A0A9W4QVR9_9GAMM|nr:MULTISPECIES: Der GTPase-activating protein YihI [unclassified Pseudoalteromonas]CAH9055327.1 Der GTPase-activating protein YihI [Pseudoalteromonas sp. CIP111854]CAH9062835.1 Der GTPase-activating protein YihI [Pseudoalteromonas sp. CIP111951]
MTRKKKTRKVASNGTPRLSKDKLRELRAVKEQRSKNSKGAKPGSRNAQEAKVAQEVNGNEQSKDQRVGSKKPVPLQVQSQAQKQHQEPVMQRHLKPQVELKKVQPQLTPEQELEQLENDERLMALLERHERGELLTGKDAKYFNRSVARHQALCELLGLDDEFEEQDIIEDDPLANFMSNDLANEWLSEEDDEVK